MRFATLKNSSFYIGFLDLLLIAFLIFDFGFKGYEELREYKLFALPVILALLIGFNFFKYKTFGYSRAVRRNTSFNLVFLGILAIIALIAIYTNYHQNFSESFFANRRIVEYGLLVYYFTRFSFLMRQIYAIYFNPAILFVGSYGLAALAGSALLMLPDATTHPITYTEALFSATSAVCVTGLMVLDLAKDFTPMGQGVILFLIQVGGLGMLTFTSFFAYFFKSGSSFKESLFVRDMLGQNQLSSAMQTTMRIVVFSLGIEAIGALFIYNSIGSSDIDNSVFFAVFHAISAYCNAGISLASDNLFAEQTRYNYYFQWIIMILVIFGGLGYAIASNFTQYLKQFFINIFFKKRRKHLSRLITLNSKIIAYTSLILLFAGALFYFVSEQKTYLLNHDSFFGKITSTMFSSVTARSSGFNTIDYADFTIPGLLVTMLLMWIGASPASTGGGIKTTTFALATLNIFSVARNKPYIEIGTRRVAYDAVRRAFAIITISLIAMGISILLLLIFSPEFSLLEIAFEVFSAFSTTGLSLGITDQLNETSRYILIFTMFFGRIGLINLLIGMLKSVSTHDYKYPQENILIN